jgi:glycosyltransferase involved in cell wall biosynthesis
LSIRVLEVVASLRRAGAEQVAVSLAGGLDRARFETAVVSLYDPFPGGFEAVLGQCGVTVWHLGKRRGFDPRMWGKLAEVVRRFRPDVLHTHSYVMRYVLPAHFRKVVHTVHNLAAREVDGIGRVLHRLAFRAGAAPVAISAAVARSFTQLYGREPVAVIPNGVDVGRGFRPEARAVWRSRHGFGPGDCLVVSVARLEAQKNPLHLIRAFAEGLRDAPAAHLLMAGEGTLLESARQLASQAGVAARVHFLGLCEDVPELLSACDLFTLGSDWEGAPVAIVEAMAAHLPVVATAVGGVPDLVEDGVTGVLAPAGDASALGRAMAALECDSERRQRMGAAAAHRVQRFDQASMIDQYAELFERRARRAEP